MNPQGGEVCSKLRTRAEALTSQTQAKFMPCMTHGMTDDTLKCASPPPSLHLLQTVPAVVPACPGPPPVPHELTRAAAKAEAPSRTGTESMAGVYMYLPEADGVFEPPGGSNAD